MIAVIYSTQLVDLRVALQSTDLNDARQAVDAFIANAKWQSGAHDAVVTECRSAGRPDLAFNIRMAAFRAGVSPYEAPYAAELFWRVGQDTERLESLCECLGRGVATNEFLTLGDAFHREQATRALNDLITISHVDVGLVDPSTLAPDSLHGIAAAALYEHAWLRHKSLQFANSQRLMRAYMQVVRLEDVYRLHLIGTFFAFHGAAREAFDAVRHLELDKDHSFIRLGLLAAIAYESLPEELPQVQTTIDDLVVTGLPESDDAKRALVSAWNYAVAVMMDRGDHRQAAELCAYVEEAFSSDAWAPRLDLCRAALFSEAGQLDDAACLYEQALTASKPSRIPFHADWAVDICAALGRWDLAYNWASRHAAELRAEYAAIVPGSNPALSRPENFPTAATFLSGWGVGDDVCRLGLLRAHFRDGDYSVVLDRRLVEMAARATPNWRFMSHSRVHEVGPRQFWEDRLGVPEALDPLRCTRESVISARKHQAFAVQEELVPIHIFRSGIAPFPATEPILAPDLQLIEAMRTWLAAEIQGKKTIGLCWRSGLLTRSRSRSFFSTGEVAALLKSADVAWVLMQYDWQTVEVEEIEREAGKSFLRHPTLDLRNDLEGVAALARACDLVMSTGVSTREVCAAAGAQVYSISFGWPHANAWRRDSAMRDTIFSTMRHVDPNNGSSAVLCRAQAEARRWSK